MRSVEAVRRDGATAHHVIPGDTVHQFGIGCHHIRNSRFLRIAEMRYQRFLEAEIRHLVAVLVESQHAVKTDGLLAHEEGTQRNILLHTAAGSDTDDLQLAFLRLLLAGVEIDVSQRVDLVHDDVAVVGTDTGGYTGDTLALIFAGDGVELAALHVTLDTAFVEERGYHIYPILVSYQDHFVCQKLRLEMQMEC